MAEERGSEEAEVICGVWQFNRIQGGTMRDGHVVFRSNNEMQIKSSDKSSFHLSTIKTAETASLRNVIATGLQPRIPFACLQI